MGLYYRTGMEIAVLIFMAYDAQLATYIDDDDDDHHHYCS